MLLNGLHVLQSAFNGGKQTKCDSFSHFLSSSLSISVGRECSEATCEAYANENSCRIAAKSYIQKEKLHIDSKICIYWSKLFALNIFG